MLAMLLPRPLPTMGMSCHKGAGAGVVDDAVGGVHPVGGAG
jgi:hypothetical protein